MKVFRLPLETRLVITAISLGLATMVVYLFSDALRSLSGQEGAFVACIGFSLAGMGLLYATLVACTSVWMQRVETDVAGIRIYDWKGRCTFNTLWKHLAACHRLSNGQWHLESKSSEGVLPSYFDTCGLRIEMLRHLPETARAKAARPKDWPTSYTQPIYAKTRESRDLNLLVFGPCAAAFVAFIFFSDSPDAEFGRASGLVICATLAFLAALMHRELVRAFRRVRRGKVELDENRIVYDDGDGPVSIRWNEVKALVGPSHAGSAQDLLIVAENHALRIRRGFPKFYEVAALAVAQAPEEAAVYP